MGANSVTVHADSCPELRARLTRTNETSVAWLVTLRIAAEVLAFRAAADEGDTRTRVSEDA